MDVTISTQNGSKAYRLHNIRDEKVASKESHINPDGKHEIWRDVPPRDAYVRLFSNALEDYNAKQKRKDRQIKDYYNHICKDEKKHPVYEMIIGVYSKNKIDEQTSKDIMLEFCSGWQERNPNLELIGAYYHADEPGEPHVHIDYVPVAHGYKKGMETQTGLVKALGEMGFYKTGKNTAQIKWQQKENQVLESLCVKRGLNVLHPQAGKGAKHLEKEAYIANQELNKTQQELQKIQQTKQACIIKADAVNASIDNFNALVKKYIDITQQFARANDNIEDLFTVRKKMFGKAKTEYILDETAFDKIKQVLHFAIGDTKNIVEVDAGDSVFTMWKLAERTYIKQEITDLTESLNASMVQAYDANNIDVSFDDGMQDEINALYKELQRTKKKLELECDKNKELSEAIKDRHAEIDSLQEEINDLEDYLSGYNICGMSLLDKYNQLKQEQKQYQSIDDMEQER